MSHRDYTFTDGTLCDKGEPLLAPRDPAMAKVLQTLSKGELDQSMTQSYLAWSPNGKWLAAQFVPNTPSSDMSHYKVVLFTGALTANRSRR
jgi:hypothetical protein